MTDPVGVGPRRTRVPLALKLVYTGFVGVLVPYYWVTYTPWNFLFFCDLALLITLAALWMESPLLASVAAVGILVPQALWIFDFATAGRVVGMAGYMFDPQLPLFVRGLSSFHGWLPFVLVWLVWKLGYDRRALPVQVVLTWVVLLTCYGLGPTMPAPADRPSAAVNVNYVFGLGFERAQTVMAPWLWLLLLMVLIPVAFEVPTHFLLTHFFGKAGARASTPPAAPGGAG